MKRNILYDLYYYDLKESFLIKFIFLDAENYRTTVFWVRNVHEVTIVIRFKEKGYVPFINMLMYHT